jgi:AcrR family transcriptional regulator
MSKIVDKRERALLFLRAATKVFATKGFAGTRIEDVAKQAGVSKGLVYEYYKTKEDLFFAVCDHLAGQRPVGSDKDRFGPGSAGALIAQVASTYDWSPDFFLVLVDYWAKILKGTPHQRKKYLKHVDAFYADRRREIAETLAKQHAGDGLHRNINPLVLSNLIIACVEGIHMQDFLCSRGARKNEVLTLLGDLLTSARDTGTRSAS